VSWEIKIVSSTWNIPILSARIHVQDKNTHEKFLHGSRCQIAREKVLQGLHLRNDLKVQLIAT
jgi:hypothetical protein